MSPPITPPRTSPVAGTNHKLLLHDTDSLCANRHSSELVMARLPLEQRLTTLESFHLPAIPKELSSDSRVLDLPKIEERYMEYVRLLSFILAELDAQDAIEFAVSNRDAVARLTASSRTFDDNIARLQTVANHFSPEYTNTSSMSSMRETHSRLSCSWQHVKDSIEKLSLQASTSGDWIDCRDSLNAIQAEEKDISAAIFMMQEQRHITLQVSCVELDVLTTILENLPEGENTGTPGKKVRNDGLSRWDRALSEAVMRMTSKLSPLKASIVMFAPRLDFFANRAQGQFPTAVFELKTRYERLSAEFDVLKDDFKKLKDELNEDKWLAVFRQVNKQASEMMNSLERTLRNLDATALHSVEAMRLIDNFTLKSEHYGKAVPAVLSIMQRGVQQRLTLNGEILRGHDVLNARWKRISSDILEMQRRIDGARSAGILHSTAHLTRDSLIIPQTQQKSARHSREVTDRTRKAQQSSGAGVGLATPQRTRHHLRVSAREPSSSPAVFRKDITMDPPRSRSRIGYAAEVSSPGSQAHRPPWNAGTSVRKESTETGNLSGEFPSTKSSRSSSRMSLGRPGVVSSLDIRRPLTPGGDQERRATTSYLPLRSPHKTKTYTSSGSTPPVPSTPSKETIDRLSRPKIPPSGFGHSRTSFLPTTPSRLRSGITVPSTPTAIPVSKRLISDPIVKTAQSSLVRPPSSAANRRQSSIPMRTPRKLLSSSQR